MRWDAGLTVSSDIKHIAKIADSNTFSVFVGNVPVRTDDFDAFVFDLIQLVSPDTLETLASPLLESVAKQVVLNTVAFGVDILSFNAGRIDRDTNTVDWFLRHIQT